MSDNVNKPAHYTDLPGLEVIDIIRASLGTEGFIAYCSGNVIKYRMRAGKKGDAAECLAKADVYERWAREAAAPPEPVVWPEDESRMDVVGQNGNDGAHYPFGVVFKDCNIAAGPLPSSEPWRLTNGAQPVEDDVYVWLMFRDGTSSGPHEAGTLAWGHRNKPDDIVSWRYP